MRKHVGLHNILNDVSQGKHDADIQGGPNVIVSCTFSVCSVSAKRASARHNHVLACNFAKYSPILKMISLTDSAINLS